jgi:hypothetical protein
MVCRETSKPVEVLWPLVLEALEDSGYDVRTMSGQVGRLHEAQGDGFASRIEATRTGHSRICLRIGEMNEEQQERVEDLLDSLTP